jgi:hypothetical protein
MRAVAGLVVVLSAAGCGPHRLDNLQPTSEALAREVLAALARRDTDRLRALAINETEFEQRVWPGLPASRPERNLPWSYVWLDLRQKSEAQLTRTLQEHGGRTYELQKVTFTGETTEHGTYRVYRDSVLTVRDAAGQSIDLRLFGSAVESEDGWKVFSYVVDD